MNNIITLKRLIDLIAKQAGCAPEFAEAFTRAFTTQLREALVAGESVKIKGIGEFSATSQHTIILEVDPELANIINEPFAMFSPEELADNVDLNAPMQEPKQAPQPTPIPEPEPATEPKSEPAPEPEAASAKEIASEPEPQPATEPKAEPGTIELPASEPENPTTAPAPQQKHQPRPRIPKAQYKPWEDEDPEDNAPVREERDNDKNDSDSSSFPYFWTIIGLVIGLIIGICLGFFAHDPIEEMLEPSLAEDVTEIIEMKSDGSDLLTLDQDSIATADSLAKSSTAALPEDKPAAKPVAEEKPAPKPAEKPAEVYETIGSGVTLAKLSKKHYGSDAYWVYIYLENQNIIKNPDNVPLGAKLRIPPLSKYATQATEAERKAAAQKKVSEIRRKK